MRKKNTLFTIIAVTFALALTMKFATSIVEGVIGATTGPEEPPITGPEDPPITGPEGPVPPKGPATPPVATKLSDLSPFHGNEGIIEAGYMDYVDADNLGNHEYNAMIFKKDFDDLDHATYVLKGEYKKMTFKAALADLYRDEEFPVWIEVWGDGRKLGETAHFQKGVRPGEYEIDLTGVDELTFRVEGYRGVGMLLSEVTLEM